MMKRHIMTAVALTATMAAAAQTVSFVSAELADGVRQHLGLTADDPVLQSQTDTITVIDLSGLGISDIGDVVYLPQVRVLNLAYNAITDVSPLAVLDSLRVLNLEGNSLESADGLAFAVAEQMDVNVALNYITDFSYLMGLTNCQLTLAGMAEQRLKNPPYYEITNFYVTVGDDGRPQVAYKGLTNMADMVTLEGMAVAGTIVLDGTMHTATATAWPAATTLLRLTNGQQSDTTYVVPPVAVPVTKGETATIVTGLPDDYRIGLAVADHGRAEADGTTVRYTPDEALTPDTVYISYYQGETLKGYAQIPVGLKSGDVNGDGKIDAQDASLVLQYVAKKRAEISNANVNRDGNVDAQDASLILQYVAKKTSW